LQQLQRLGRQARRQQQHARPPYRAVNRAWQSLQVPFKRARRRPHTAGVQRRRRARSGERVDERRAHLGDDVAGLRIAQLKHALQHAELGGGCVQAAEGCPVVHDHARADHVAAAIDRACHQGYLRTGR